MTRLARAAAHVLAGLALLLVAGAGLQALVERDQRARYPAAGQLVDIGDGRVVHLRTWGTDNDGPALVLSVSANMPSSAWAWVAQDLAREHRVVAFDRPGMGWSQARGGTRDARSAAEALSAALDVAGIEPPYVVVGHSYGGFAARAFVGLRGEEVAGLVLLDTTQPAGDGAGFATYYRWRAWLGHVGVYQLFPPGNGLTGLPDGEADAAYASSLWTSHLDASADELEAWVASVEQVRAVDLSALPLLVVSGIGTEAQIAVQRGIAGASSRSRFVELPLGHVSMLTDREQAAQVADEIRRFVTDPPD